MKSRKLTFKQAKARADEIIEVTAEEAELIPELQNTAWRWAFFTDGWYLHTRENGRNIFYRRLYNYKTVLTGIVLSDGTRIQFADKQGVAV